MRVVGIDMSLSNSGWVVLDELWKTLGHDCVSPGDLKGYDRTIFVSNRLIKAVYNEVEVGQDIVVFMEDYVAGGRGHRTAMEIAKIQGILVAYFKDTSIPVYLVHPSQLRSFQKENVKSGRSWSEHEEDAWGLAFMGVLRVGLMGTAFVPSYRLRELVQRLNPVFKDDSHEQKS